MKLLDKALTDWNGPEDNRLDNGVANAKRQQRIAEKSIKVCLYTVRHNYRTP